MSEVAVLSKIIAPSGTQPSESKSPKKSALSKEPLDPMCQKDPVRTEPTDRDNGPTASSRRQDSSRKEFNSVYEEAISQTNDPQDTQDSTAQAQSASENPSQDTEKPACCPGESQPAEAISIMQTVLSAGSPQSTNAAEVSPQSQPENQPNAPIPAAAAPASPQVPVASQAVEEQGAENAAAAVPQPQTVNPQAQQPDQVVRPAEIPEDPQLQANPQGIENKELAGERPIQNAPSGLDVAADRSQNPVVQQLAEQAAEGQSPKPPEALSTNNIPAQNAAPQSRLRAGNAAQVSPETPPTAADGQQPARAMKDAGQFEFSGDQNASQDSPGTDVSGPDPITDPPGQEIRNDVSIEHAAQPAANASVQAAQTPSRLGVIAEQDLTAAKPVDQIASRIASEWNAGEQTIRLTLTPAHLGTVRITFTRIEDEIVGMLQIQKADTRREIEQALPQLITSIQESGVAVRKIDLLQWDANPENPENDRSGQFDPSQQREFSQQNPSDPAMRGQGRPDSQTVSKAARHLMQNHEELDLGNMDQGLNLFV